MTTKAKIDNAAKRLIKRHGVDGFNCYQLCNEVGILQGSFIRITGQKFGDYIKQFDDGVIKAKPMERKRAASTDSRIKQITAVAMLIASTKVNYKSVNHKDVASKSGISSSTVRRYFNTREMLHDAIIKQAVKDGNLSIIAQGVVDGHRHTRRVSKQVKNKALQSLIAG